MKFETWFPTIIGTAHCPFIKDIQSSYKKIIKKYPVDKCGFINIPIHLKPQFKKLTDWITQEVNTFSKSHRFVFNYEPKESWIWDYKEGTYQGFHTHIGFTISTVFFLEGHKKDSPIVFKSPINDMKNPLGSQAHSSTNADRYNSLTFKTCAFPPQSGMLLVWRSYIEHKVDAKQGKDKRIAFVYNFDPDSASQSKYERLYDPEKNLFNDEIN